MSVYRFGRTVAEFTKRYRESRVPAWTQEDLADRLDVHPQYISNVERGAHKAPIAFVKRFVKILDQDRARHLYGLVADEKVEALLMDK